MRRQFALWILSGLLITGTSAVAIASPSVVSAAEAEAASLEAPAAARGGHLFGIRDEAAMVLLGTILIGLAGAVRRAA